MEPPEAPIRAVSVAPPGFVPARAGLGASAAPGAGLGASAAPGADAAAFAVPTPAPVRTPADAAVRWRLRAATVDNLLVYAAFLALCLVMHWHVLGITAGHVTLTGTLDQLFVLGVLSVAYHFAFESRGGQTPGKRRYGIQVLDVDGGPAGPKAIAIRSVLRIIDQLPVWYLSGLVSMVRTGPQRRQRIGDVAAGTTVVAVDGRAMSRGTPRWYLPVATVAALAMSALLAYSALKTNDEPLSPTEQAQFVAGCQAQTSTIDCTCLLHQLQADGYTSADQLRALVASLEPAVASGRGDELPRAFVAAALACRT